MNSKKINSIKKKLSLTKKRKVEDTEGTPNVKHTQNQSLDEHDRSLDKIQNESLDSSSNALLPTEEASFETTIKQQSPMKKEKNSQTNDTADNDDDDDKTSSQPQDDVFGTSTFEQLGVNPALLKALSNLKWDTPTLIQEKALPWAFQGRDIIGLAKTGSGKTGAFALPVLQSYLNDPHPLFCLVLSPTRELAIQIAKHFEALGSGIGVKSCTLLGGVDHVQQAISLARRPAIVVGSPGRVLFHLKNTKGFSFKNLKYLILDEADRLLNPEFEVEVDEILELLPRARSTFLFSATMTNKVEKLQRAALKNPVKIEVADKYSTVDKLVQKFVLCPQKFKDVYFVWLLNEFSGNVTMVFVATKKDSQRLCLMLRNLGFQAVPLHGDLDQNQRLAALNKFTSGDRKILICSDVASRGLDIPTVDHVINYDLPTNSKDYIHRVGRTARGKRSGVATSLVTQYDVEAIQRIEDNLGKKLETLPADKDEVMIFFERVSEAQRYAAVELKEQQILGKGKKKFVGKNYSSKESDRNFEANKVRAKKSNKKRF